MAHNLQRVFRMPFASIYPLYIEKVERKGYTEEELLGKTPRVFKSGRHDKAFYEAMWAQVTDTGYWQG